MNEKGRLGEYIAEKYLKTCGYSIKEKNYSCRLGEIDIIAQDNEFLVFIEVKYRSNKSLVDGLYSVNKKKQIKIIKTAINYMFNQNIEDVEVRFDVINIKEGSKDFLTHIKNAFEFDERMI